MLGKLAQRIRGKAPTPTPTTRALYDNAAARTMMDDYDDNDELIDNVALLSMGVPMGNSAVMIDVRMTTSDVQFLVEVNAALTKPRSAVMIDGGTAAVIPTVATKKSAANAMSSSFLTGMIGFLVAIVVVGVP